MISIHLLNLFNELVRLQGFEVYLQGFEDHHDTFIQKLIAG